MCYYTVHPRHCGTFSACTPVRSPTKRLVISTRSCLDGALPSGLRRGFSFRFCWAQLIQYQYCRILYRFHNDHPLQFAFVAGVARDLSTGVDGG